MSDVVAPEIPATAGAIPLAPAAPAAPLGQNAGQMQMVAQPVDIHAISVKAANDLGLDIPLVKQALAAIAAKKYSDLAGLAVQNAPALKSQVADVLALAAAVKSGWKTSEFWMIGGDVVLNVGYWLATKQFIPLEVNAPLAAAIMGYAHSRATTKSAVISTQNPSKTS